MVKGVFRGFFKNNISIIKDLFTDVISSKAILLEYELQNTDKILANIRIGHLLASFLFLLFGFYDFFIIEDKSIFYEISVIRLIIFFLVLSPFFILTLRNSLTAFFRFSLFFTYLVFGGFIIFISYKFNVNEIAFIHNYLALNLTIIGLFVILTYKVSDSILLAFLYIIGYNLICYFHGESEVFFSKNEFNLSNFLDINIWLILISFLGYIIWRYNDNLSKENFLIQRALLAQKAELKKANDVRNKFFSIIAHDLKNLISSQYSLSNFLAEKYSELPEHKIEEFVKMIEESASRTLNVFEELMIWVHAQTNRIAISPINIQLQTLINNVIELLEVNLKEKEISVVNNISSGNYAFCDENVLKTVLRNILGNAIKFSHKSGRIVISCKNQSVETVVKIQDYGVGMIEEELKTLFKVDKTSSKKGTNGEEGTGLGLILCDELLKLNKGKIWVESVKDKGTAVLFSLPKEGV